MDIFPAVTNYFIHTDTCPLTQTHTHTHTHTQTHHRGLQNPIKEIVQTTNATLVQLLVEAKLRGKHKMYLELTNKKDATYKYQCYFFHFSSQDEPPSLIIDR